MKPGILRARERVAFLTSERVCCFPDKTLHPSPCTPTPQTLNRGGADLAPDGGERDAGGREDEEGVQVGGRESEAEAGRNAVQLSHR